MFDCVNEYIHNFICYMGDLDCDQTLGKIVIKIKEQFIVLSGSWVQNGVFINGQNCLNQLKVTAVKS